MKTNKKTKAEENEYWLDNLLEQPENHKNEPDGSILYGYNEEPKLILARLVAGQKECTVACMVG